jgi:hypothetical protein
MREARYPYSTGLRGLIMIYTGTTKQTADGPRRYCSAVFRVQAIDIEGRRRDRNFAVGSKCSHLFAWLKAARYWCEITGVARRRIEVTPPPLSRWRVVRRYQNARGAEIPSHRVPQK